MTDQLGTPRMIFDKTGALPNVKRQDYAPFGEELFNGARTTAMGYGTADSTRQKFTQKERDNETGLDFFGARYYGSTQGRFTSPDEFTGGPDELYDFADAASSNPTFYADFGNPQSLNKYQYAYNNPLRYIDPDGHDPLEPPQDPVTAITVVSATATALEAGGAAIVAGVSAGAAATVEAVSYGVEATADAVKMSARETKKGLELAAQGTKRAFEVNIKGIKAFCRERIELASPLQKKEKSR